MLPDVAATLDELLARPAGRTDRGLVAREVLDTLTRNPPIMTFRSPAELDRHTPTISQYLRMHVLPHLDARSTVRDFADRAIERFQSGRRQQPVLIAAALLVLDEPDHALSILQEAYPPDSSERQNFAAVLAAVATIAADTTETPP